ncbi:MAG: hypothetical protein K2N30_02425, partial [Clostridia bacterium]|nr:hypothetical protein [Clostridia bacterium]
IKRKRDFGLCFLELSNSLNDVQNKKLEMLKLLGYQMLHEASAENFARGFRCAVRLFCDSMSNDNDGMPEPLDSD